MAFSGLAKLTLLCLSIVTAQGRSFIVPSFSRTASRQSINGDQSSDTKPIISRFHINSNIEFRYAHTTVESYVKNPSLTSQEVTFTAIIPNSAFISNFSMVFDGKEFVATVAAKEEAKRVYEEAVSSGRGAGLVSQDVRDSNKFMVSANVEPQAKVVFKMTYEELLERKLGWYEHVININPGQVVNDLKIEVNIDESRPLDKLSVPELKQSNEIDFEPGQENEIAQVDWERGNATAKIEFAPNKEQQEEYGEQGLTGQLLVKYDVERDNEANEIQVIDGYFVHFFTPENLKRLPKHAIFVLDISGSMSGDKIVQLKDAMFTILDDMTEQDYFNIITFSYSFTHWELPSNIIANNHHGSTTQGPPGRRQPSRVRFQQGTHTNGMHKFNLIQATDENKREAIKYTNSINANGGTNINDGLLEGLKLAAEVRKNEALPTNLQSIIVFLSDGEASSGETNGNAIKNNVKNANLQLKVPIYSLGFGSGADFNLIKDISTDAGAFAKQIYEDSDAALQLEDFFAEISSPLLSDLKFNYIGGLVDNSSISQNYLATFYKGGEFIVTGKLQQTPAQENDFLEVTVSASGENGTEYDHKASICLRPCALPGSENITDINDVLYNAPIDPLLRTCPVTCLQPPPPPARSQAQNFLKNLHAFLNIKQLLKKTDETINGTNPSKEKALNLSLANNFVTELTSLIVTRPNQTAKISSLQDANEPQYNGYNSQYNANTYHSYVRNPQYNANTYHSYVRNPQYNANTYHSYVGNPQYRSSAGNLQLSSSAIPIVYSQPSNLAASYIYASNSQNNGELLDPLSYDSSGSGDNDYYGESELHYAGAVLTTPRPTTTTTQNYIYQSSSGSRGESMSYDSSGSGDNDYYGESKLNYAGAVQTTPRPTTTTTPKPCSITMFSKTYYRGESIILTGDRTELGDFDDKVVSIQVKGNCCWQLFSMEDYKGKRKIFREGHYRSTQHVGIIFREASSVKKFIRC